MAIFHLLDFGSGFDAMLLAKTGKGGLHGDCYIAGACWSYKSFHCQIRAAMSWALQAALHEPLISNCLPRPPQTRAKPCSLACWAC